MGLAVGCKHGEIILESTVVGRQALTKGRLPLFCKSLVERHLRNKVRERRWFKGRIYGEGVYLLV